MARLSAAKQKKGRGRNKGHQPKTNPAERIFISIDEIGVFVDPKGRIIRTIGCILKRHVTGPYTTWNKVPPEGQAKYWNVFKETYWWNPENEDLVHQFFKKKSAFLMHKMFSLLRNEWIAKNKIPDWFPEEHFNGLKKHWESREFKIKSDASKKGQKKTHRGGSNLSAIKSDASKKGQKETHHGGSNPSAQKNYVDQLYQQHIHDLTQAGVLLRNGKSEIKTKLDEKLMMPGHSEIIKLITNNVHILGKVFAAHERYWTKKEEMVSKVQHEGTGYMPLELVKSLDNVYNAMIDLEKLIGDEGVYNLETMKFMEVHSISEGDNCGVKSESNEKRAPNPRVPHFSKEIKVNGASTSPGESVDIYTNICEKMLLPHDRKRIEFLSSLMWEIREESVDFEDNIFLTLDMFLTLEPGKWLDGGVLDALAYVTWCERRSISLGSRHWNLPTHFSTLAQQDDLLPLDLGRKVFGKSLTLYKGGPLDDCLSVSIPIYDSESNHWLLCRIDFEEREIKICDTLRHPSADARREKLVRNTVKGLAMVSDLWQPEYFDHGDILRDTFPLTYSTLRQPNTYDCGIYVCLSMIFGEGVNRALSEVESDSTRERIAYKLVYSEVWKPHALYMKSCDHTSWFIDEVKHIIR